MRDNFVTLTDTNNNEISVNLCHVALIRMKNDVATLYNPDNKVIAEATVQSVKENVLRKSEPVKSTAKVTEVKSDTPATYKQMYAIRLMSEKYPDKYNQCLAKLNLADTTNLNKETASRLIAMLKQN